MKKNGFTLIEIAVATMIIGLLATLGTMAIMRAAKSSRVKNTEAELNILSAAVLQLAWDTGKWPNGSLRTTPGSVERWDISRDNCGLMGTDGTYTHWKGTYYEGALADSWGNPYFFDPDYRIRDEDGIVRDHIVVGSFGPNGQGRNQYDDDDIYVLLDD
jgi:prepilin-type N-terminal cleavage/methylation domain-containing protein